MQVGNLSKISASVGTPLLDPRFYQQLVGKLIYLTISLPNLAYVVFVVGQFMHAPTDAHLHAVFRILRYLKAYSGRKLFYMNQSTFNIPKYSDADWVVSLDDQRSTSGYVFF